MSQSLNKGVLPRQHTQIRNVMSVLASQQTSLGGKKLCQINKNLMKQVRDVNRAHAELKSTSKFVQAGFFEGQHLLSQEGIDMTQQASLGGGLSTAEMQMLYSHANEPRLAPE